MIFYTCFLCDSCGYIGLTLIKSPMGHKNVFRNLILVIGWNVLSEIETVRTIKTEPKWFVHDLPEQERYGARNPRR